MTAPGKTMAFRHGALAAATALLLAGCGGQQGATQGMTNTVVERMIGTGGGDTYPAEAARLINGGAPRLAVEIPGRDASLMVKAGERDGVSRWRSIDNVQFYFRDGQLIGTRGMGDDLMSADNGGGAALIARTTPGQVQRSLRYLDGEDRIVAGTFTCQITPKGAGNARIPGGPQVAAQRVEERCAGDMGRFTNFYWVQGGRILQADQFVSRGIGRARITFLP